MLNAATTLVGTKWHFSISGSNAAHKKNLHFHTALMQHGRRPKRKTVHRIKAINHLIPLELKVEVNEHSLDPSLDANLSQNMENPILEAQAPNSIHTDDTRNLENPHPADICQRLEFNVLPDTGEPWGLPDCKRPKPTKHKNVKLVQCTNNNCETWCHYVCADLPYKTIFTQEQPFICPLCSPRKTPHRSNNNTLTSSQYNSRGLPIRKAALEAKRKLRRRK